MVATRVCAGIVGFADLTLGDAVRPVLERQIMAAGGLASQGGRFCGIRQILCWDQDQSLLNPAYPTSENMTDDPAFRAGFCAPRKARTKFRGVGLLHPIAGNCPACAGVSRDGDGDQSLRRRSTGAWLPGPPRRLRRVGNRHYGTLRVRKRQRSSSAAWACTFPALASSRCSGHRARKTLSKVFAALDAALPGKIRAAALHVGQQFPGGQGQLLFPHRPQCRETADRRGQQGRKARHILAHGLSGTTGSRHLVQPVE